MRQVLALIRILNHVEQHRFAGRIGRENQFVISGPNPTVKHFTLGFFKTRSARPLTIRRRMCLCGACPGGGWERHSGAKEKRGERRRRASRRVTRTGLDGGRRHVRPGRPTSTSRPSSMSHRQSLDVLVQTGNQAT
jgi:hypothetical protein